VPPLLVLALTPLVLVVGTLVLVVARARALGRPLAAPPEPVPLSPGERAELETWERHVRFAVALVVTAYLVALAVALGGGLGSAIQPTTALFLLGLACFSGVAVQFSARCPRCGFNLGFQSRLVLPEQCERCGADYGDRSPNPEIPSPPSAARADDSALSSP
jgi:hypothetical protein